MGLKLQSTSIKLTVQVSPAQTSESVSNGIRFILSTLTG